MPLNNKNTAKNRFKTLIKNVLKDEIKLEDLDIDRSICLVLNQDWDISSSIALRIAKIMKKNPKELAESITSKLSKIESTENPKTTFFSEFFAMNGYINAKLNIKNFSKSVLEEVLSLEEKYGHNEVGKGKVAIIEYPSVNPNKPWHVGHIRNPLLGDSISRIMSFSSYKVLRTDYIEDLGLQMAEILWGSKNLEWNENGKKYDQFLGEKYVEINKHIEKENVKNEISVLLKNMEDVSSDDAIKIREISEKSVKAQYQTSFSYGVYHDLLIWESDILREKLLEKSLDLLKKNNLINIEKEGKLSGCTVLKTDLSGKTEEKNKKVLLRSNGVPTYLAKDIAFHMWKLGIIKIQFNVHNFIGQPDGTFAKTTNKTGDSLDFNGADIAINVIGSAQNEPQIILKNVFKLLDGKKSNSLIHLSYGEVSLKEGKISGRSGKWLGEDRNYTADDLLKFTVNKVREVILSGEKISKEIDIEKVSKSIALSAIKFDLLRIDPIKKIVFDWDRALDLNSNSGPYCVYMYARCCRILEKSSITIKLDDINLNYIERDFGFELLKLISKCNEIVEKALTEYKPNIITDYLIDLSQLFGKFYEHNNVLKSGDAMVARLAIVNATKQTLYNMLMLLGIEPLSSM
ncbi:MAG: arginine--tRNA ligase [Candidatus Micrarchaeia archaeon]